jgi:ribosomal protein L32
MLSLSSREQRLSGTSLDLAGLDTDPRCGKSPQKIASYPAPGKVA